MAPVAAEIIPGRPPAKAVTVAMRNGDFSDFRNLQTGNVVPIYDPWTQCGTNNPGTGAYNAFLARVESGRRPPWRVSGIDWRAGFRGLDLVRYNRIEGLSLDVPQGAMYAFVRFQLPPIMRTCLLCWGPWTGTLAGFFFCMARSDK